MPRKTKKGERKNKRKPKLNGTMLSWSPRARRICPERYPVTLRYTQTVNLDPGVGAAAAHLFRSSSIYDPDFSGIGGQPRGHDQLYTLYRRSVVMGSKCSVRFVSDASQQGSGGIMGVALRDTTTVPGDYQGYTEGGKAKYIVHQGSTAGSVPKMMSQNFSAKRDLARTSNIIGNSEDEQGITGGPLRTEYFHVFATSFGSNDSTAVTALVTLDYLCLFYDPLDPVAS